MSQIPRTIGGKKTEKKTNEWGAESTALPRKIVLKNQFVTADKMRLFVNSFRTDKFIVETCDGNYRIDYIKRNDDNWIKQFIYVPRDGFARTKKDIQEEQMPEEKIIPKVGTQRGTVEL